MPRSFVFAMFVLLSSTSAANPLFQAWCDTFTAQGLVSLAANRIYGRPLELSEEEHERRREWVNAAYREAAARFQRRTGLDFDDVDMKKPRSWWENCQTKDVIQ